MNFFKPEAPVPFNDADRRFVEDLFPHLRRAIDLALSSKRQSLAMQPLKVALAEFSDPCLVVDESLHIVDANLAAQGLIGSAGNGLARDGRLEIADPEIARDVADAVRRFASHSPFFAVERQEFSATHGSLAGFVLSLVPMAAPLDWARGKDAPVALLRIIDTRTMALASRRNRLQNLFGLTEAECDVVEEIGRGLSPADVAKVRGVSVQTIRKQVRSIFTKTGTRKQGALAALIVRVHQ